MGEKGTNAITYGWFCCNISLLSTRFWVWFIKIQPAYLLSLMRTHVWNRINFFPNKEDSFIGFWRKIKRCVELIVCPSECYGPDWYKKCPKWSKSVLLLLKKCPKWSKCIITGLKQWSKKYKQKSKKCFKVTSKVQKQFKCIQIDPKSFSKCLQWS